MKKKILVIIGNYLPPISSTASVFNNILNLLYKEFDFKIITDNKFLDKGIQENSIIPIYTFNDSRYINSYHLHYLIKNKTPFLIKTINFLFYFFSKVFYFIFFTLLTLEPATSGWKTNQVIKLIKKLHEKHNFDIVISASLPFRSHLIAHEFISSLDKAIPWVAFQFDPFAYNKVNNFGELKKSKLINLEDKIFRNANINFLNPELYSYYLDNNLVKYLKNSKPIDFIPNLTLNTKNNDTKNIIIKDKSITNFLFTGQLYKDIRDPTYLISIFDKLGLNYRLFLFTNFTSYQISNIFKLNIPNNVIIYPYQSKDSLSYHYSKSDVLVNIGNSISYQIPGKIIEYIQTKKPIIHFQKNNVDYTLKYLINHPAYLTIKEFERSLLKDVELIKKFINEISIKKYDYRSYLKDLKNDSYEKIVMLKNDLKNLL